MDEKDNGKPPDDTGGKDEEWKAAAKKAGEQAGTDASLKGETDAKKVADAGQKKGTDAAWQKGGDAVSQAGGEIGKESAIQTWGDQLKSDSQRDLAAKEADLSPQVRTSLSREEGMEREKKN